MGRSIMDSTSTMTICSSFRIPFTDIHFMIVRLGALNVTPLERRDPRTPLERMAEPMGWWCSNCGRNVMAGRATCPDCKAGRSGNIKEGGEVMKTHELKTLPEYFKAVNLGVKMFEVRKNDRDFKVGDVLILREWLPTEHCESTGQYSGRKIERTIGCFIDGVQFGIKKGYCVLGFQETHPTRDRALDAMAAKVGELTEQLVEQVEE